MNRLVIACAVWLCSIGLALPLARPASQEDGRLRDRPARPSHAALSLFAHSDDCVACHNQLAAESGADVSIGTTWRSTMMANSARDPYWQAGVRREAIDHPTHAAAIEDECAGCHMPMAARVHRADGTTGQVFAHLPITSHDTSPLQRLAADGVSCSVCHQISPDTLGTPASFNGRFVVSGPDPARPRAAFGPYAIDRGRQAIMQSVTGFAQAEAPHVKSSELCASCHTLITQAYGPGGEVIGSLPEQMNFQEWQHSDFPKEERGCQSCHMPRVSGPIRIASVLGETRDGLSRHLFVGGNAFMVRMLGRHRDELGVEALEPELEATAAATIRQLQTETADLSLSPPAIVDGRLAFDVRLRNLSGHKLPTGYPARRVWLHVTVRDTQGTTVFESGAIDDSGAIRGNDGDRDAPVFEPHYEEITQPDEVQIYEAILGDQSGRPTTGLLSAIRYLKDTRLLPRGFDKRTADPTIGVYGGAAEDPDFAGGGDVTRYRVPVAAPGPYRITVEARYQSIGYRWAHNLERYQAPEPTRFLRYYNAAASGSSVVMATATSSSPQP
jgi:hypothetical protein